MDTLVALLGRNGFLPHGYCFTWSPGLLWSMVGADAIIAAAYFSIPVATLSYIRKRPEAPTITWVAWLFSAFIFACGLTHVMDIWTIWQPDYVVHAATKVVTAAISLVTAVALWPLIPKALKIPSVQQLQNVISALEAEVGRRRSAEDQLAAIQQSLAATLASIDAGFIATDRDGRVTHMNAVAETVTGWMQRDAMGMDLLTVFEREDGPAASPGQNPVDRMLAQDIAVETAHRAVAVSRSGARTPLELKSALTRDDDGQVTGMALVFRDVSRDVEAGIRQRRAEAALLAVQRLEAENRQFQEANRLKSQFLANMSHELRTPLNAVIGFADLLHSGIVKPDSPKHREFLGHIGTSGRHLLQLINDVLDLSKVESGKFEFFPERVDLHALLKDVQDILHTSLARKHIRMTVSIDPGLTELVLDPARLRQVLYNYLSNAIKFTGPGGQVAVRAMGQGPEHLRIEVEDNGIGIAPADLPRLFTEFQQLDTGYSRQHPGTGLGLSLTRRLVQAQGGRVGVRSTVGAGSVFYVVLNRTHGLDARRADEAATGGPGRPAPRALVIEDDPGDRSRLAGELLQAGFEVDTAADGQDAVQRARATEYAALTLDMNLPGHRGLQLLGDIRQQGASHASPVLGVTMPSDDDRNASFAIANVLCKPVRSDEILRAMTPFKLSGGRRATVMVIDDEQASLDLMSAILNSIGIDAVCFQDGRLALQDIDRHRPDAIVLDLMMPAFDGFQVLDALQRIPAWRDVPVFIWTSMLLTDEEYASLARSARAILIKGGGALDGVLEGIRRWRQPDLLDGGALR